MGRVEESAAEFQRVCGNAVAVSRKNLQQIIEDNKDTAYGREHGFSGIISLEEYQEKVPLGEYAEFEEDIDRMMDGEENVLTAYPVKHYLFTSGSTGRQKKIPLTEKALAQYSDTIYAMSLTGAGNRGHGPHLHMSIFRTDLSLPGREHLLSAAYFRYLEERGQFDCGSYVGGRELLFTQGAEDVLYMKAWLAFAEEGLVSIQSIFLYDVLLFFRYCEDNWGRILEDLEHRFIPPQIRLSGDVRRRLLACAVPQAARLNLLREECGKGFAGIARRLWNRLEFISGVGGGAFQAQEKALRKYTGSIPLHYYSYAASECLIGPALEREKARYVIMPDSGFYEFIPYEKEREGTGAVKTIESVQTGKEYELAVTNFSGLYRYRMGDIVRVTGFYGEAPVIEVLFRKNQAVNLAGEKTDFRVLAAVMEELEKEFDICIYEYSVCEDLRSFPGRYLCFLEDDSYPAGEYSASWDHALMRWNSDYLDLRQMGQIAAAKVIPVQKGTHGEYRKTFGSGQGHNKPKQYLSDPAAIKFMTERRK